MIRDSLLKKYIYRSKKHCDTNDIKGLLKGIREKTSITADYSSRTSNLASLDGLPPFPKIPNTVRLQMNAFSQIGISLEMAKTDSKQIAVLLAVLLDLNTRCMGNAGFSVDFYSTVKVGHVYLSIKSEAGRLFLHCKFTCPEKAALEDRLNSLRGAITLFEAALRSPGKFDADLKRITSKSDNSFAFSAVQPLAQVGIGDTVAHLLGLKLPSVFRITDVGLYLNQASSWTAEDFNRGVQLVNENAGCFKNVSLIYAWSPARWEEYEVLEDYYGLFGPADTDACLFEFTLPSGKGGMTAMTYGKKGYRLYVSFDDGTAIKEFEKLTGVKCEVF